MNTKRLRLLIIPVVTIVIFVIVSIVNSNVDGIKGEDWVKKSNSYIKNANSFIENMDNTLTLYFSGITNPQSYSSDYELLKKQWKLLKADYDKFKEENSVLPDTDNVPSKMNREAADAFYNEIDKLFKELDTVDKTNAKHISYVYLAHQQDLVDQYATYMITYNIITGVYDETVTNNATAQ